MFYQPYNVIKSSSFVLSYEEKEPFIYFEKDSQLENSFCIVEFLTVSVYQFIYSCEKEGRCTVVKSNGTTDNKCGPKVAGE